MLYALADAAVEAVTFAALVAYMRRVAGADPMHVGWFVVRRHGTVVALALMAINIVFLCIFLRHTGSDTKFHFAWLRSGFEYDPSLPTNSTAAQRLLWT